MIKLIKRYSLAIAVVIPLVAIILIRSSSTGRFRYDANRWAEPSFSGSNIVTPETAARLKGSIVIIELDKTGIVPEGIKGEILIISPDSVMNKMQRKLISKNRGPVLIHSADHSLSAKIWMVLSQSGLKNVYILSEDPDNETGKEKFRPDSVIKPEL